MGAFIWVCDSSPACNTHQLKPMQIQIKYCNRDDAQIRALSNNYEEMWGTRIPDLVAAATAPRLERVSSHPFAIPHASKRIMHSGASSQMYPLGRSLDELRLHSQGNNWSNAPHLPLGLGSPFTVGGSGDNDALKQSKNEGDADSSSKNGGTSGRLGESLPSLKSSGLLDSWNSATASTTHSRTDMRELSVKPPPGMESDVRSTTLSGMPVGLQWLANESR